MPGKGRPKPKMPKGFSKGQKVRIRSVGKMPSGLGEVLGGCYGREDYVNVLMRGAGKAGRPKLGCVPTKDVKKA